jgi:predicted Zn-dependent peptidase
MLTLNLTKILLFTILPFYFALNCLILPVTAAESIQPYLDQVKANLHEFSLNNGIKFIVLENHQAPVISFVTYADVGGVNEPDGKTGVAHFLEHLAFKGTTKIGTTDYVAEKPVLDNLDKTFDQLQNQDQNQKLIAKWQKLKEEAREYVKQNEFGQIVEIEGGVGLNAATSADYTAYYYNFPANKLELWMSLESERFLQPVFREFYEEKEVILEERRLRTDNSPIGKMIEAFLDTAFTSHPYKRPVIGYDRDIRNLKRKDVEEFFGTYYTPNNLTIAIVGDVQPEEVETLAKVYFDRYPQQTKPPQLEIVESPQTQTREVDLVLASQPWYLEGYHRPSLNDADDVVYDVISGILSNGRTSRLYQSLVEDQQVALAAQSLNGFPGNKYPNLIVFYALSAPNHSLEEVETAIRVEIDRLTTELVTESELNRVKTKAKASLLRTLDTNEGMASLLAEYEVKTGSWLKLFEDLDRIEKVTAEDVQRVAQTTFTAENRTIGRILEQNDQI